MSGSNALKNSLQDEDRPAKREKRGTKGNKTQRERSVPTAITGSGMGEKTIRGGGIRNEIIVEEREMVVTPREKGKVGSFLNKSKISGAKDVVVRD